VKYRGSGLSPNDQGFLNICGGSELLTLEQQMYSNDYIHTDDLMQRNMQKKPTWIRQMDSQVVL
jgi:hypothetical protein